MKNVVTGLKPEDYFLRGSIVEVTPDVAHPVMAGMPAKAAVFMDGGPVFETGEGFDGRVLATYQESGSPLLSGFLIGEKYLNGKAAALEARLDKGRVILLRLPAAVARSAVRDAAGAVQCRPARPVLSAVHFFVTFTPPLCVRTRIGGAAGAEVGAQLLSIAPAPSPGSRC